MDKKEIEKALHRAQACYAAGYMMVTIGNDYMDAGDRALSRVNRRTHDVKRLSEMAQRACGRFLDGFRRFLLPGRDAGKAMLHDYEKVTPMVERVLGVSLDGDWKMTQEGLRAHLEFIDALRAKFLGMHLEQNAPFREWDVIESEGQKGVVVRMLIDGNGDILADWRRIRKDGSYYKEVTRLSGYRVSGAKVLSRVTDRKGDGSEAMKKNF